MSRIQLKEIGTRAPEGWDKSETKQKLQHILEELDEFQNLLYAECRHSVLVIIQGMDASGKDGLIRHVFGKMNPQGVSVKSFKAPTAEEDAHDFLWRVHQYVPAKGMIQIFNRSHYESVLITRVHEWCDDATAKKRMGAINDFERLLIEDNNTQVLKFYLHVSPERQQKRLSERLSNPRKMWKYDKADGIEASNWDKYRKYYEDVFERCNEVPWHIIPADQNWYKEYLVAERLRDTFRQLKMQYPDLKKEHE